MSVADARTVGEHVTSVLLAQSRRDQGWSGGPAWLDAPAAERRTRVWQAIGMLNGGLRVPSPDALAVLRARAFAIGVSVDELSAALVDGEVPLADLSMHPDGAW